MLTSHDQCIDNVFQSYIYVYTIYIVAIYIYNYIYTISNPFRICMYMSDSSNSSIDNLFDFLQETPLQ